MQMRKCLTLNGTTTPGLMILSITTLSIMALSIITLCVMTPSITIKNETQNTNKK